MKIPQLLLAGLLVLALTGCMSFVPAGPVELPPQAQELKRNQSVMVEDINITDGSINENIRKQLTPRLTSQLARELEEKSYFHKSISFPAKVGEEDVQLHLTLTSLKARRTPHPAYFPGAILTATIWIWANGPIYVDKYDLAGELSIADANGKVITNSQSSVKDNQNTGFWSEDYINPSLGARQLNQLIDALLQDSLKQLP